jgi:hypothetical protein
MQTMDPIGLWERVEREWPQVKAAPASFTSAVLGLSAIFGFVIWLVLNFHYTDLLEGKEAVIQQQRERISALGDRIDEYKTRLQGASPSEAATKIANLEKEVEVLRAVELDRENKEWQPLNESQIATWAASLSTYKEGFVAVFFEDESSSKLRDSLYEIVKRAGWPEPTVMNGGRRVGIGVRANEDEPAAPALIGLFKTISPDVEWIKDETVLHKIQIYIGKKAQK